MLPHNVPNLRELSIPEDSQDFTAGMIALDYPESATHQHGIKRRIVKKRDRRIKACTQCRDRKLKCSKGQPCSRCQNSAEECIYVHNASDLAKAPKRDVRKRKRPINVCRTCRDRKIPCDRGDPCSNCAEAGFACVYKTYNTMSSLTAYTSDDEVQVLGSRELAAAGQRQPALLLGLSGVREYQDSDQRQPSTLRDYHANEHHNYAMPALQYAHPESFHHSHSNRIQLPHHTQTQHWQPEASSTNFHTPPYDDEGYSSRSVTASCDYQGDHMAYLPTTPETYHNSPYSGYVPFERIIEGSYTNPPLLPPPWGTVSRTVLGYHNYPNTYDYSHQQQYNLSSMLPCTTTSQYHAIFGENPT